MVHREVLLHMPVYAVCSTERPQSHLRPWHCHTSSGLVDCQYTETWSAVQYKGNPMASLADDLTNMELLSVPTQECMLSRSHSPSASHCPGPGTLFPLSLQQEGELIWNHATLHGWLHDYAGLQRLLLLCAEMLSRAPSRGTELTAMTYRNIQTRSTCNLLTFGQHVTLLPQYSKTTALTGHEKPVPPPSHPLSSLANRVAPAYSLVITRPFSQLAAKICFRDESIVRLYKDLLFVNFNKKFTEDLSAVMANYSLPSFSSV